MDFCKRRKKTAILSTSSDLDKNSSYNKLSEKTDEVIENKEDQVVTQNLIIQNIVAAQDVVVQEALPEKTEADKLQDTVAQNLAIISEVKIAKKEEAVLGTCDPLATVELGNNDEYNPFV